MLAKVFFALVLIGNFGLASCWARERTADEEIPAMAAANDLYFRSLSSWEGVGDLKEVFTVDRKTLTVPDLKAEPVRIERLSKIRFLWDKSRKSLRAVSRCVSPTKLFQSDSETEIVEDLQINCLIRPDGFYRFEPNLVFSDFVGYPQFGKVTRVIEKRSLADFEKERSYSYLFDPGTMFEIHGHRVDSLFKLLPESVKEGTASIQYRDSLVTIIQRYKRDGGTGFRVEWTVDPAKGYLPVHCSGHLGDDLIETSDWEYSQSGDLFLPIVRSVKKFDHGTLISSRTVSISESRVNKKTAEADFSLESIGSEDEDRLIDRDGKKIFVLQNGKQTELAAQGTRFSGWLIVANVMAIVFLLVTFGLRAKKPSPI